MFLLISERFFSRNFVVFSILNPSNFFRISLIIVFFDVWNRLKLPVTFFIVKFWTRLKWIVVVNFVVTVLVNSLLIFFVELIFLWLIRRLGRHQIGCFLLYQVILPRRHTISAWSFVSHVTFFFAQTIRHDMHTSFRLIKYVSDQRFRLVVDQCHAVARFNPQSNSTCALRNLGTSKR